MLKYLLPIVIAAPAFAAEPKELPGLWYDLIAAEELAKTVGAACPDISVDDLVTYRLRNVAVGELADFGIHNRTPRKPMTIEGFVLASLRIGAGVPLGDDICEFAKEHMERQTSFGSRLNLKNE